MTIERWNSEAYHNRLRQRRDGETADPVRRWGAIPQESDFERGGVEVFEATSGEEALRIAQFRHPALVLLDVNLPDISGIEVCEQLKRNPDTADICVIQITGAWLSDDDRARGMVSGADEYLIEPVDDDAAAQRCQLD